MEILGVDIGGTGIKGAVVDVDTGAMLTDRYRLRTPRPAKPRPVVEKVAEIVSHYQWQGAIGAGFPAAIQHGVARTAANIHHKWIDTDVAALIAEGTGSPTVVVNDADAAGLAEMTFGAGKGRKGVVVIVTIGTGLGTAIFSDGQLVPNTELGHIEMGGVEAELLASDAARKRELLSWEEWGARFDRYLQTLESLLWPDLFILGGGASKKHRKFMPGLTVRAEVVAAQLLNEAGIIGAAVAARRLVEEA